MQLPVNFGQIFNLFKSRLLSCFARYLLIKNKTREFLDLMVVHLLVHSATALSENE